MSADRKRSRQKQASEQNQATVAAAAASSSAAAPRAKKIRVGVVRSPAAAAAADSADSADYQREVAALRLRSQRSLRTDQLIATISMSDSELAERIEDYREEMKRDAKRAVSMLDTNYKDIGGMTLLMHVSVAVACDVEDIGLSLCSSLPCLPSSLWLGDLLVC